MSRIIIVVLVLFVVTIGVVAAVRSQDWHTSQTVQQLQDPADR